MMSLLLASCTSPGDPNLELNSVGFNAVDPGTTLVQPGGANFDARGNSSGAADSGDGASLPDQVAYLPIAKPASAPAIAAAEAEDADAQLPAASAPPASDTTAPAAADAGATAQAPAAAAPAQVAAQQVAAEPAPGTVPTGEEAASETVAPKKKGLFASLFSSKASGGSPVINGRDSDRTPQPSRDAPRAVIKQGLPKSSDEAPPPPAADEAAAKTFPENQPPRAFIENLPAKPVIDLEKPARRPVVLASYGNSDDNGLPGVRQSALFEIKRKSGLDDDSDVDVHEEDDAPMQLASAAGLARLAPNGLLTQTEDVDVACLKPSLVRVLKVVEQRFGKRLIVTSGYRSRMRNIRARGAKNSLHMFCAAADIQVPGVSKLQLASFLRAMPGRGGVGTYCHTNSVHVDVGPERDWNWRCGRRKKA
ncbi:MAG: YcbK family protein [Rhizobiaceae bacterium]|nr:YcbK family protein [Rhizobiaceae bacterium]